MNAWHHMSYVECLKKTTDEIDIHPSKFIQNPEYEMDDNGLN